MNDEQEKYTSQSIEDILKDFEAKKSERNSADAQKADAQKDFDDNKKADSVLPEPEISLREKSSISGSKNEAPSELNTADKNTDGEDSGADNADAPEKESRKLLKIKKREKEEREKKERKKPDFKKAFKKAAKPLIAAVVIIAVAAGAVFGINRSIEASKTAYLKPYEEKYPGVDFPEGILEKYCDAYGENPDITGYLTISDTDLSAAVLSSADEDGAPYAEPSEKGCEISNFVVYLNDNSLEALYSTADSYNESASGFMSYSDLKTDYNFKIVGAFYTNTKAEDDNDYIFPYNVTEKQTADSANDFIDRLHSRFLYSTGVDITRSDTLLTISCPTLYREDFRFVIVGVARDDSEKLTASEKTGQIHFPQVIYDETGEENSYRFAEQWYPEIIVGSSSDDTSTSVKKQSIKDYD